jgi:hypothetical protein
MFLRETVQPCSRCAEVTPHSRRVLAVPQILGLVSLGSAGWSFAQGEAWMLAGGVLLVLAAYVTLHDREKSWSIRCERCRARKQAEVRRQKPKLDRNTEINLL